VSSGRRERLERPLRFAAVGVVNTAVDIGLFAALTAPALGIAPAVANVASYSAGMIVSFALNRNWTFRAGDGPPLAQFLRFVVVNLSALVLSTLLVAGLARYMAPVAAKLLSLPVTFAWGFLLNRRFVFRAPPVTQESAPPR
jgi:putative flippase GtrA